ncbi:MAG: FAD-binding protein [Anaerolineaceae bacterium]|nr:MAG: FAD-binding protein [Anaerolineaceae bacterium]
MINNDTAEVSREFIHEMSQAIGEVHFDRLTRLLYSTDASIYQIIPIGVAIPRDEAEITAAIEIASRHDIPILPRGGGSSLAGQAVGQALVLDFSRYLDRILEVNPEEKTVRTQPGITLSALNRILNQYDLMYGPDPASGERATMGGILANNSTGAHSIVYGMTVDHVLATEVILADGTSARFEALDTENWKIRSKRPGLEGSIYRAIPDILQRYKNQIASRYPKVFRHVAGYNLNQLTADDSPNLAKLIVGSEGTLAVITEMTLKLVPVPKLKRLAMVHYADLPAAMDAVPIILESDPTAIEVLDKMLLDLTRDKKEYNRLLTFVEGDPAVVLLVEYSGDTESELDAGITRLRDKLRQMHHQDSVIIIADPAEQANVWFVRKVGLGILMSIRGDTKPIPFIEDAAVPVGHLTDYVTNIFQYSRSVGVEQVAMYAHASAGCLHIRPLVNLKTVDGVQQLRQIAERSVELVTQYGGTTSGEHGEGLARGEFSEWLFGTELVEAFREVKRAFDPAGLMNPGKVVDGPKMDDQSLLRIGPHYAVPHEPRETVFSFAIEGGFARAVEMCNGAGVCRQLELGVMCPSFQAMRDEAHSTRGRANALRAAMMGFLGPEGMTSQELYDVLDLCLSCHACKVECPSAVDMAKIKAEFLHNYYRQHGTPLRAQIFGNIAKMYSIGQHYAALATRLLDGPVKNLIGIHPKRSIPQLSSRTFSDWFIQYDDYANDSKLGERAVIFFHDTFTEHNHPHIGQAAIKALRAAGFKPFLLPDKACCGRPAVSKGLLDEAARLARHNIELLAPYAREAIPIVGIEPSCMTMLRNEYLDLLPGDDSNAVAEVATTVESLIVQAGEEGNLNLRFRTTPRHVLFHGHCQQKAVFGTENTHKLLQLIPDCRIEEIESGCCGMAGSFGYEKEHYELSVKLAEMSLAPAVREASEETIICASGTSCRDQIKHTTGRRAMHPIEVFADALIIE